MVVTFESVYDTEPCLFTSSLWWIGGYYALASPAMGHWGTCPLDLQQCSFFHGTLTYTQPDSDYMLAVTSCKHLVTFVPLLAPNPGDATAIMCTVFIITLHPLSH